VFQNYFWWGVVVVFNFCFYLKIWQQKEIFDPKMSVVYNTVHWVNALGFFVG
jgi:hypothetical protein